MIAYPFLLVLEGEFDPGQTSAAIPCAAGLVSRLITRRPILIQDGLDLLGGPTQIQQLHSIVLTAVTETPVLTLKQG